MAKVDNIIEVIFGNESSYFERFKKIRSTVIDLDAIYDIAGFLGGLLDDLENGFLKSHELLMAGEMFDSILDQAKHLNKAGFRILRQFWQELSSKMRLGALPVKSV